jgi:hypothetical protein
VGVLASPNLSAGTERAGLVRSLALPNRSALEWVIDQSRVTQNERGNIVSDPNRLAAPQYIVRFNGQVATHIAQDGPVTASGW